MLHRKIMWRDRYSATGCSPALQAVDSKQAENLLVGKTKSYWTNNIHQHEHHQRHIQRHVPGQARPALGVFARPLPMASHDLEEGSPRHGTLALEQRVAVI